jgi:hypothetical protein
MAAHVRNAELHGIALMGSSAVDTGLLDLKGRLLGNAEGLLHLSGYKDCFPASDKSVHSAWRCACLAALTKNGIAAICASIENAIRPVRE